MDPTALNQMLRLCLSGGKEEARAFWDAQIAPHLGDLALGKAYTPTADQRWWLWCTKFSEHAQGAHALQRLLLTDTLPWNVGQQLLKEALPSIRALPSVRTVVFPPVAGAGYVASSPCIVPNPDDPEGFLVSVRHVNYEFLPNNRYPILPAYQASVPAALKDCVRTKNVLHVCTKDLTLLQTVPLEDKTTFLKWPSSVLDLEDLRLFSLPDGMLLGLAASREVLVSTQPQCVLVHVDAPGKAVRDGVRLLAPKAEETELCQKNWLPVALPDGMPGALYLLGPEAILVAINPVTGVCDPVRSWTTGLASHAVRGGAAPVPWEHGLFIAVVHTSLQEQGVRRRYVHRFLLLAEDYRPLALSEHWNFSGQALHAEFVISCVRASESTYYLGYGENDGVSKVAEVAVDVIKDLHWYKVV